MTHLDGNKLDQLWDFNDPAASEKRLRDAARDAEGVVADELRTQLARALGLQGRFAQALTLLEGISTNDAVVQQRIALERGRVFNSSGDVGPAISAFQEAYRLDADAFLTVDAIHMLAMTDMAQAETWYERGLEMARHAHDPRVRRWEGSLRNNHAWHLADEGNLDAALVAFREAEEWFREHGNDRQVHIARWSVAHVLRRLGRVDEAREILLDLKSGGAPDEYVDEELALLGGTGDAL